MNNIILFFTKPKLFFIKIIEGRLSLFILSTLIVNSLFYFYYTAIFSFQSSNYISLLSFTENKWLYSFVLLLGNILVSITLGLTLSLLSKLITGECKLLIFIKSIFSLNIISICSVSINIFLNYIYADTLLTSAVSGLAFIVQMLYLFIAINMIIGISKLKSGFIQIGSIIIIATVIFTTFHFSDQYLSISHQTDKSQVICSHMKYYGEGNIKYYESKVKWTPVNPKQLKHSIGKYENANIYICEVISAIFIKTINIYKSIDDINLDIDNIEKIVTIESNKSTLRNDYGIEIKEIEINPVEM